MMAVQRRKQLARNFLFVCVLLVGFGEPAPARPAGMVLYFKSGGENITCHGFPHWKTPLA